MSSGNFSDTIKSYNHRGRRDLKGHLSPIPCTNIRIAIPKATMVSGPLWQASGVSHVLSLGAFFIVSFICGSCLLQNLQVGWIWVTLSRPSPSTIQILYPMQKNSIIKLNVPKLTKQHYSHLCNFTFPQWLSYYTIAFYYLNWWGSLKEAAVQYFFSSLLISSILLCAFFTV